MSYPATTTKYGTVFHPHGSGSSPSVNGQEYQSTQQPFGHHSARSADKLTYALYSGGISDAQKREIVDGIRLPDWEGTSWATTIADPALVPDIKRSRRVAITSMTFQPTKPRTSQHRPKLPQSGHYWAWLILRREETVGVGDLKEKTRPRGAECMETTSSSATVIYKKFVKFLKYQPSWKLCLDFRQSIWR